MGLSSSPEHEPDARAVNVEHPGQINRQIFSPASQRIDLAAGQMPRLARIAGGDFSLPGQRWLRMAWQWRGQNNLLLAA